MEANSEGVLLLTEAQMVAIPELRLVLHAGARLYLLTLLPPQPYHNAISAHLFKGGRLHLISLNPGNSDQDLDITLDGEGAEANIRGVTLLLGEARQARVGVRVTHHQPHTRCAQLFQSVVGEACSYDFRGLVHILPAALGTDTSQLSRNLMLHDSASVHAEPRMQIFADDVKATHGATTGGPSPDALFYLRTRGLAAGAARKLYMTAFIRSAFEGIEGEALRGAALAWLETLLSSLSTG